ncbi:MAG: hypothetical protein ABI041_08830, partial [Bdellovibrionia bacterium]
MLRRISFWNRIIINRGLLILLAQGLISFLFDSDALGRLVFTETKGMQEHIRLKPEFNYLGPITTFNFQRQSFLVNLVNYPAEEASAPLDENGTAKGKRKLDPIATWVASTFVAPMNTDSPVFFQVSPLAKNVASFLGPSTIGSILNSLTRPAVRSQKSEAFPHFRKLLKQELQEIIENDPEFHNNLKIAAERSAKFQRQLDDILNKSHASNKQTPEYQSLRQKRDQYRYEKKYLSSFLNKLLDAWFFESFENLLQAKDYPDHIVERTLMALAWMNTRDQDKSQFISLYEKIPHLLLGDQFPHDRTWLKDSYTAKDYEEEVKKLLLMSKAKERPAYLLENPEKAAFLSHGYSYFDLLAIPEIRYRNITYHSKSQGLVSFTDCMETSVLAFLAILLKNPVTGLFDPNPLQEKLKQENLQMNPRLLEFIKDYPHLNALDTTLV